MRNTILATVAAFGLSAFAFGGTTPATPATPAATATTAAQPAPAVKVDPKMADCQKQAKEKGLKRAEHKKFVAECVKAK
jgi:membrane-bound lytic murein transglycosylase B